MRRQRLVAESGRVADAALVLLVVRLQPRGLAKHLAVEGVLDPVLDRNNDGLVHLVADDQALPDLACVPFGGGVVLVGAHAVASSLWVPGVLRMPSSRSRSTV